MLKEHQWHSAGIFLILIRRLVDFRVLLDFYRPPSRARVAIAVTRLPPKQEKASKDENMRKNVDAGECCGHDRHRKRRLQLLVERREDRFLLVAGEGKVERRLRFRACRNSGRHLGLGLCRRRNLRLHGVCRPELRLQHRDGNLHARAPRVAARGLFVARQLLIPRGVKIGELQPVAPVAGVLEGNVARGLEAVVAETHLNDRLLRANHRRRRERRKRRENHSENRPKHSCSSP